MFVMQAMLASGAVGSGAWLAWSSSWAARFLRERIEEFSLPIQPAAHRPTPLAWSDNRLSFSWLGHATVLVNFYGLRILIDPALFPRVGVDLKVGTLGPKRLTAPALKPSELPEIDLVLVSHAHFDHLDQPSLAAVRGRPTAVMAHGTLDLLPRKRYSSASELRWGESVKVDTARGDALVRSIEVKHWGARIRSDHWRGYSGFIVERAGHKLLFGGDTADTRLFANSHRTHGPFEAAFMPVGAYDPWIANHCTPEQAVAMADAAGARLIVPIHHQTFVLSREPFHEPIERTRDALARELGRLPLQEIGQTVVV
jgi:L-ascorbate metabolism protein UlaG (beta-lactamase superfamily)